MLIALRGLKRIRTAVDGFADRWLSHSPIRPYAGYIPNRSAKIDIISQYPNFFTKYFP